MLTFVANGSLLPVQQALLRPPVSSEHLSDNGFAPDVLAAAVYFLETNNS
jgi:hypothetical protein